MVETKQKYIMTVSLNVLNHLGIGLYSNVSAVLSEAIANAWDADAANVDVKIDTKNWEITICDDGHGMSVEDANEKYLNVGYERRKSGGANTPRGRSVMGRKGIGKLSLFSIANVVEVHSVKDGEIHGFKMTVDGIKQAATNSESYYPEPIDSHLIDLEKGTRIVLTGMNRRLSRTGQALKRRLARRFSIIGAQHNFEINLNGEAITIEDRAYQDKIQYIWTFGTLGQEVSRTARNKEHERSLQREIMLDSEKYAIDGWIGTVRKPSDLKDQDTRESINGIVIMVRGKLAQENILDEFGDQNLYSEYVIGEFHADFLDQDDKDDIATTSRQHLIEEDPRYDALKTYLGKHLRTIQNEWRAWRDQDGEKVATAIPQIEEWYDTLSGDYKKSAQRLFGRINRLPIEEEAEKRRIFIGSILAFESLRFRNLVSRLDDVSTENLGALADVFNHLDDIEQSAYYQITRDRIDVIRKLNGLVDANAKERALQEHLYKHLWLLDPSWERATHTELMERRIHAALDGVYESLSDDVKRSRLDIYYTTTGNKHVIIELKRADRPIKAIELQEQVQNYHIAALQSLASMNRVNEPVEIICVLGNRLSEWDRIPGGEQTYRAALAPFHARIVMYDELIQNALEAYQDYVDKANEAGRTYRLIRSIEDYDVSEMHPDG